MQIRVILILLFLISIGCSTSSIRDDNKTEDDYLGFFYHTLPSYYSLVEFSLSERELSQPFYSNLNQQLAEKGYLDAASVQALKAATKQHQQIRETLIQIAEHHQPWLNDNSIPMQARIKGIMLSLSAALTAFDNYLFAIYRFQQHRHLRRIINAEDSAYFLESQQLLQAGLEYYSLSNYHSIKKAIKFYQHNAPKLQHKTDDIVFIEQLIEQSPHYKLLQQRTIFQLFADKLNLYTRITRDTVDWIGDESTYGISKLFGNLAGLVATRKGLLFDKKNQHIEIRKQLKAGDILLEKTPFRLTDSLIPGYWGHAAIWLGSEEELKALGIWNDDRIRPYHTNIREGKQIIEAVRSGVHLSSLNEFLNIDDLAVLRKKQLSDIEKRHVIFNALAQLGKGYDFNFDVETSDRIVCSELVYMAYTQTLWPTEKTLGRYAISPNHIAEKTVAGDFLLVKLYYHGEPVSKPELLWQQMLADKVE